MSDDVVLNLTPASAIKIRPVFWLWLDRLALGSLALLGGREGIGKTLLYLQLAADVTRGRLSGVFEGTAKNVVIVATEDSWAHTIAPRLIAAGADMDRVFRLEAYGPEGIAVAATFPRDLAELRLVCRTKAPALIVFDPLLSRLDGKLDSHKDAEVRRALEPLAKFADETNVCILGLIHVNKSVSTDPLTMLMASRAFAAVSRAVLFVMKDPDDDGTRLVGQPKNNLGHTDLPTLAFRVVSVKVADTDEGPVYTGKLTWVENTKTLDDALTDTAVAGGDRTAVMDAAEWLREFLTDQPDQFCDSATVKREAAKAGHHAATLNRARKRAGVVSQSLGYPRKTVWSLPATVESGSRPLTTDTTDTTDITRQSYQSHQSLQLERDVDGETTGGGR